MAVLTLHVLVASAEVRFDDIRFLGDLPAPVTVGTPVGAWGWGVTLAGLVIAAGLWRLHRWAWTATMLWVGVSMSVELHAYFNGEPRYPVMVASVATVFYLNLSDVQRVFHAPRPRADGEAPRIDAAASGAARPEVTPP